MVVCDTDTGQPIAQGTQVYGDNVPNTSNYVNPVATYSNGQLTFIGNIAYSYTTGSSYQVGAAVTGTGTLGPVGIEADVNENTGQQYTMTNTGAMYVNFSVNLNSSYGSEMVQSNGVNGPTFNYALSPQ